MIPTDKFFQGENKTHPFLKDGILNIKSEITFMLSFLAIRLRKMAKSLPLYK